MYFLHVLQLYLDETAPTIDPIPDLSGLTQIAHYTGPYRAPGFDPSAWLEFEVDPPMCGRYFTIIRTYVEPIHAILEVQEIEIFAVML